MDTIEAYRGELSEKEDSLSESSSSSSTFSVNEIEGELGHYLEQLENIGCWDERSKCVASVLGDVFASVEQVQGRTLSQHTHTGGLSEAQLRLQRDIEHELGEVKNLVRSYVRRHPSISDDPMFVEALLGIIPDE